MCFSSSLDGFSCLYIPAQIWRMEFPIAPQWARCRKGGKGGEDMGRERKERGPPCVSSKFSLNTLWVIADRSFTLLYLFAPITFVLNRWPSCTNLTLFREYQMCKYVKALKVIVWQTYRHTYIGLQTRPTLCRFHFNGCCNRLQLCTVFSQPHKL